MKFQFLVIALLAMLVTVPAFAGSDSNAFEFPPTTPLIADVIPPDVDIVEAIEGIIAELPAPEEGKKDWAAFFENFLIPLISVILGLFGGGLGVRFKNRFKKNRATKKADLAKVAALFEMLGSLVPELHGKVVSGDSQALKRDAALLKAKKALDEAVDNGS